MAVIRPRTTRIEGRLDYDGDQLRSHFIYDAVDVAGDAVVSFRGRADVKGPNLVDLADRKGGLFIGAADMLHFVGEFFGPDLDRAVMLQRLFVMTARETAEEISGKSITRHGDDLFFGKGKLSVSIATVSSVSSLIHFGINIVNDETPVETSSLTDLGIEPNAFADRVLERFADDLASMAGAAVKVRSVR